MAQSRSAKPFGISGVPRGVNNTADETALPRDINGNTIAVREAVNVDVSGAGKLSRRAGYAEVLEGECHSAWSDDYLPFGLFVDGDTLKAMHADESTDVVLTGLAPAPVSYERVNDIVLFTNGVQFGQIGMDLSVRPWGVAAPGHQPGVLAIDGGLDPGSYQIAVTLLDASGRESGALRAAPVELPNGGGIRLFDIPAPPAGGRVRVYCTSGHDGVLRAAATFDSSITEYDLTQPAQGRVCDTQGLRVMPAGQCVAYGNGRMFVARGNEILFSESLRYGLYHPGRNRVAFNGRITMIAFVGDGTAEAGLYVSDSKRTYFLSGADPKAWGQQIAYHCGAHPGQLAWTPGELWGADSIRCPVWLARNGRVVVGMPGGRPLLPQPSDQGGPDAAWDVGDSAAIAYLERPGDRRVIASISGAAPSALAMQEHVTVIEYRHNT